MRKPIRSSGTRRMLVKGGGAVAAVLVLSAVAWVPAASAAVSAGASIISTGTGGINAEDHFTPNVLDPGDELSPNDLFVRTLDATRVNLSYTPDVGSTNLTLTATISTPRAGWDLRGTNFGSPNGPCPGGISTPTRDQLVCVVGATSSTTPVNFDPVMRISALAGNGFAFHVDVTVADSNSSATVSTPDITTSAAPRFDLEKSIGNSTRTPTSFDAEGIYMLKIADPDPLGISALAGPAVTFTDHVDADSRIHRCDDTTPVTLDNLPVTDANAATQYRQVVGTCNGAGFNNNLNNNQNFTGLTNGQDNPVSMANIDWDRIYPPPAITGISDANSGWIIASMQYFMETDTADVELGDNIPNNGVGTLTVGNAIGMSGYNSTTDAGIGPSVWNPVDIQNNPNLGSDDIPGLGVGDLADNTATTTYSINLRTAQGKYISELTVDHQRVVTSLVAVDGSTGAAWPTAMDLCDKFDNRREHIVQAPNSTEAVVNTTEPNAPVFANAIVEYGRSAGWGPGAGPTSTQWWNMSQSGCDPADVVGGTFFTSAQVDWTNTPGGPGINAEDVNMVRYRPSGPYLNAQTQSGTYYLDVHFQVADNNDGDYIVDHSSYDPDGAGGASTWDTSSCNGGTPGSCPDPPELANNNANFRPGPGTSGVMIHMDSHPTIVKNVVGQNSGTTPVTFTYELDLGNTRVAGDATPRQNFTVRDVLPPELDYDQNSASIISNTAGLNLVNFTFTPGTQGNGDVLTWEFSGLTLDVSSADMPVIRYTAEANVYTPSSGVAGYVNRASIAGPGILNSLSTPWSPNSTITPEQFLYLGDGVDQEGLPRSRWGVFDEARVTVNGAGRVIMEKTVDAPTSEPGDTFNYTLTYGNAGGDVERMDAYDILPFDGDPRGSVMQGRTELLSVTEDPNSDVDVWISDTAPATLDVLDSGSSSAVAGGIDPTWNPLPATGSATWPCLIQQAGQPGCPALSSVTAIRIVGADPNPGATGGADSFLPRGDGPFDIELAVRSQGGRGADEFHNNWSGAFPPLGTPAIAAAETHTLMEGALGDRVFEDVNENGIFDTGDQGIANVEVTVFDSAGSVVATTQTDANGRWLVEHLRPDDYRVRIPSTEFDVGGTLEDFEAAPGPAPDPDANLDEAADHDAHQVQGGIEAGGRVTLSYNAEPLLDDIGSLTFLRDVDANLTVDFAVVPVEEASPPPPPPPPPTPPTPPIPPTTTTIPGPPTKAATPPRSLPRTGWESLLWILIGGSLVIGGAMVISRRQDERA